MAKAISSKMITVQSRGYITTSRGRFMAPIRTPYLETTDRIWSMITQDRADVWERLSNGKDIQLNAQNFDQDNNAPVEEKKVDTKAAEPVTPVTQESASKPSIDPVPAIVPAIPDVKVEEPTPTPTADTTNVEAEAKVEETAKVEDTATQGTVEAGQETEEATQETGVVTPETIAPVTTSEEEKKPEENSSKKKNKKDKKAESAALEVKAEEA